MIDEAVRPELEALLRATLDEMIPKLVPAWADNAEMSIADVRIVKRATGRRRRSLPRFAVAGLVAAAAVVGLIGVATRDADQRSSTDASSPGPNGEPVWYQLLRPALPPRFARAALTLVTETQIWFVAIDETDGKALEIQLSLDLPQDLVVIAEDATGRWEETPQGYRVVTPESMMVSVSCDIGAQGRDFAGPPNYCDMASSGAFTKPEIRAVAVAVAGAFDKADFTSGIGSPDPIRADADRVKVLIAAAVPGQHMIGDTDWGPADRVFDYSVNDVRPYTSVRVVQGVYPRPAATEPISGALYDGGAAFWVVTADGMAVRVSSWITNPEPVQRLQQLAFDVTGQPEPSTSPTSTVVVTTTSGEVADDQDGTYYSTTSPMLIWPDLASTRDATSTDGYGMALCSGGSWTKFTSVLSVDRERQTYQGTLCAFTNFNPALGPAIASCASMSAGTNYARCQQQPGSTVGSAPAASVATHDTMIGQDIANAELLPTTPPDAPQIFGDQVSAAVPASPTSVLSDGSIHVLLSTGSSPGETCFVLQSSYWSSEGCLGTTLLSTGLAYAAFVDGDGPIEIVGIVPDDVATVGIAGKTMAVEGNVWHYTAQPGDDLTFTVFSADHSLSASVG